MVVRFTIEELIKKVRELVSQNPDFEYRKLNGFKVCSYTKGANCEGCLFGQAMISLQPDIKEFLIENEGLPIERILSILEIGNYKHHQWCAKVQCLQDYPRKWGDCIEKADAEIPI